MRIEISEAARKHGIRDEQIRHVVEHCGMVFDQPAPPESPGEDRLVFLGDDERGVALEIMAVTNWAGHVRVIHAMKLRRRYRKAYEEALEWRINPST